MGFAFVFGMLAIFLLYSIAKYIHYSSIFTLILSGIIINGFFGALISLVQFISDSKEVLSKIVFWLLGGFVSADMARVKLLFNFCVPILAILFVFRYRIDMLSLDDEYLKFSGINPAFWRLIAIICITLMAATQVSVSGNIGWIGLIVPHITRTLIGISVRDNIFFSFIFGAIFMLAIDDIARSLTNAEIPLRILSTFVGAPIFVYLLREGQYIKAINLLYAFGSHCCFKELNFEIKNGENLAILGLNGTGKSTLLKVLMEFIRILVVKLR